MINNSELEEDQRSIHYSHQGSNKYHKIFRKCTMCNKPNMLMKLPDELQEYSQRKKMESWFCCSCLQVVNFLL